MRRIFLFIYTLTITVALFGQVGINTKTPYTGSVFHIDAKGNNTSATTVTAAQSADDIVINAAGDLGVGTVDPTAVVHIDSSNGTLKPIRIADGSQGINKYLFSDTQGRVTWKDKPMPNGIVYYSATPKTYPKNVYSELPAEINSGGYSRITIPRLGNYVFTLRWWGSALSPTFGVKFMSVANIRLCQDMGGGSYAVLDETPYYAASVGSRISFTVSFFASNLTAGTVLFLQVAPIDGYDWVTGYGLAPYQVSDVVYYPSIMVYNV